MASPSQRQWHKSVWGKGKTVRQLICATESYRTYTLNAIKTAPSCILRRVRYDETLAHSEDVAYWREVFHVFTPITVKSPTRRDLYYRRVSAGSLSRRPATFHESATPRFAILDRIRDAMVDFPCDAPQRKFDVQLKALLLATLANLERG
ncbi:hypothetical protein [Loktanella fryxellensis]|uniref:hypothetical protein n=1 Tax=Loktanella fryxellensis TaxID=245187 RepID=UPI00115FA6A7|nr:hypothetical protein [Loktanella fryxellensis]